MNIEEKKRLFQEMLQATEHREIDDGALAEVPDEVFIEMIERMGVDLEEVHRAIVKEEEVREV